MKDYKKLHLLQTPAEKNLFWNILPIKMLRYNFDTDKHKWIVIKKYRSTEYEMN